MPGAPADDGVKGGAAYPVVLELVSFLALLSYGDVWFNSSSVWLSFITATLTSSMMGECREKHGCWVLKPVVEEKLSKT